MLLHFYTIIYMDLTKYFFTKLSCTYIYKLNKKQSIIIRIYFTFFLLQILVINLYLSSDKTAVQENKLHYI